MENFNKYLGSIVGAAVGDAMGASTEMLSKEQIIEYYGNYVKSFITPPNGILPSGRIAGKITDDFSVAYYLMKEVIDNDGKVTATVAKDSLIKWSESEEKYTDFGGPTTLRAIDKLKRGQHTKVIDPKGIGAYNHFATNGSAMKIFPIGLLHGKNKDIIIKDVLTVCEPTHYTNISMAGACAIACAVGEAISDDATIDSIIEAGIYGAKHGYEVASEKYECIAGPSIHRRIELAVKIGKNTNSFDEAITDISELIGTGILVAESVPAVFGLISALGNDTMKYIYAAVNCGYDTDTVASMGGAILGALNGIESIDKDLYKKVSNINNIDFELLTEEYGKFCG